VKLTKHQVPRVEEMLCTKGDTVQPDVSSITLMYREALHVKYQQDYTVHIEHLLLSVRSL